MVKIILISQSKIILSFRRDYSKFSSTNTIEIINSERSKRPRHLEMHEFNTNKKIDNILSKETAIQRNDKNEIKEFENINPENITNKVFTFEDKNKISQNLNIQQISHLKDSNEEIFTTNQDENNKIPIQSFCNLINEKNEVDINFTEKDLKGLNIQNFECEEELEKEKNILSEMSQRNQIENQSKTLTTKFIQNLFYYLIEKFKNNEKEFKLNKSPKEVDEKIEFIDCVSQINFEKEKDEIFQNNFIVQESLSNLSKENNIINFSMQIDQEYKNKFIVNSLIDNVFKISIDKYKEFSEDKANNRKNMEKIQNDISIK